MYCNLASLNKTLTWNQEVVGSCPAFGSSFHPHLLGHWLRAHFLVSSSSISCLQILQSGREAVMCQDEIPHPPKSLKFDRHVLNKQPTTGLKKKEMAKIDNTTTVEV